MARMHDERASARSGDFVQPAALGQPASIRPAFFVDSAGVATPGNLVRGDGFTMRHGDVWPAPRRRDRGMH